LSTCLAAIANIILSEEAQARQVEPPEGARSSNLQLCLARFENPRPAAKSIVSLASTSCTGPLSWEQIYEGKGGHRFQFLGLARAFSPSGQPLWNLANWHVGQ
jgi:hypothetical protein